MANYAWATRKDWRNAVVVARAAQNKWAGLTAFNRGQILYRLAETLEDRRGVLREKLALHTGVSGDSADSEVTRTIDHTFAYAGWADKYAQLLSSVNPVSASFFNFTTPEPSGVIALFAPHSSALLGLVVGILPIILSGNSVVVIVENIAPTLAIDFAEAVAVSDVPAGVINLLTGQRAELITHVAGHDDVNGVAYFGERGTELAKIERESAENLKRVHHWSESDLSNWSPSLYHITPFVEYKTAWHPMGF